MPVYRSCGIGVAVGTRVGDGSGVDVGIVVAVGSGVSVIRATRSILGGGSVALEHAAIRIKAMAKNIDFVIYGFGEL